MNARKQPKRIRGRKIVEVPNGGRVIEITEAGPDVPLARPRPGFLDPEEVERRRQNRLIYAAAIEYCEAHHDDLVRIANYGHRAGDEETIKAATSLALWSLKELNERDKMFH